MSGEIKLSPKFGLNPSIPVCFFCGEDKNEVVVPGLIRKRDVKTGIIVPGSDEEAPHRGVWDTIPCDKCKGFMEKGIILIQIRDGDNGHPVPYRTGPFTVIKEEALRRMINPGDLLDKICKVRFTFLEESIWKQLGVPVPTKETKQ